MPTPEEEEALRKVTEQANAVRQLKSDLSAKKEDIDSAVNMLLELKKALQPMMDASKAMADEAKKQANVKEQEEKKAAARAKKKAEKESKGKGGGAAAGEPAAAAKGGGKPAAAGGSKDAPPAPPAGAAPKAAPSAAAPSGGGGATRATSDIIVKHHSSTPPVLSFLAAKLGGLQVHFVLGSEKEVVLHVPGQARVVRGDRTVARYFARLAPAERGVYGAPPPPPSADAPDAEPAKRARGAHALSACRVDEWLERAEAELGGADMRALVQLNGQLAMRTFLEWHQPSLADAAAFAALAKCAAWAGVKGTPSAAKSLPHLARWHGHLSGLPAFAEAEVAYLGGARKGGKFNIELPGAERGKVVTRFAPEPSGFLHIGHAKAALLSAHFADEWDGQLLLRFDDTNPSKEKAEYEEAIVEDVHRLGLKPVRVTHTSDYFPEMLALQTRLISEGKCYVDPSPAEAQQKLRFERKPSPYRDAAVEESLRLWKEMQEATELGLTCCVRAKMDPASENGTLRDPTTFRCNLTPHALTGSQYKVYPTYDFACPWVDAHEGVTHALRDRQYKDRDEQYFRMADLQGVRRTEIWSFSRINFKQCLLSKRKLNWFVETGRVDGWNDPRMPTMQGFLRRGMTVEGLRTFILLQGASVSINLMEWDKIWAENRKAIDPTAARYTAVTSAGAVTVRLRSEVAAEVPAKPEARSLLKHKKNPELGTKLKWYSDTIMLEAEDAAAIAEGEEVTLMDWGNAVAEKVHRDAAGAVTALDARLHLAGDVKHTKKKLTWVAAGAENVAVHLVDLDHLITKDSLEEEDELVDGAAFINDCTMERHPAIGEPALRTLKRSQIVQIERRGFYICNAPYIRPADPVELIFVPDGKNFYGHRKPQKAEA